MQLRYAAVFSLCLGSIPGLGQPAPGWQVGLRAGMLITPWHPRGSVAAPGVSYTAVPAADVQPLLLVQRNLRGGAFLRASLNRLPLPSYITTNRNWGDSLRASYGSGVVTFNTVLRLEAGHTLPLGRSGRTRLLGAAGVGLFFARTPSQSYAVAADTTAQGTWGGRYWGGSIHSLERRRRVNGLLGLRLGLTRELRWRDVLTLEAAYFQGLSRVYRATQQLESRHPDGPAVLGAAFDTRASFWEIGLGYHWQAQKKKLGLTAYPRRVPHAARQPWQPLPARGLYLTAGLRAGAALARQGRLGYRPDATIQQPALPVFSARLGYQWPAGWLAEAGPQTVYVPLLLDFDPEAAVPGSRGLGLQSAWELAPQHGTELTGWPLATGWALMGGRRWALRPDRWYATAKAGLLLHHYTGPAAYGYTDQLMPSTPTQDYSEFSFSFALPARWRVLAQVEGEIEARISRRTLLGLQLAYAVRPVGQAAADRALVNWYYNGAPATPVVAYSRMASLTAGLQLRRVLQL